MIEYILGICGGVLSFIFFVAIIIHIKMMNESEEEWNND